MDFVTETGEETQAEGRLENWLMLMDPSWAPASENEAPPLEAVVGLWPAEEGGKLGKFRPNPEYAPSDENSPSDPLDAVLRLVLQGRAEVEHIQLMLRDSLFDIAMNGDGRPLVTKSPDDVPCVVVATGEPHRQRISSPDWLRIDLDELVVLLADGVDVLFNPAGPASVRLTGDFMRETLMLDDEQVAELYANHQDVTGLRVMSWTLEESTPGESESSEKPVSDEGAETAR
ncbi:type VII secretion system-associated protein [Saccharopolyspora sp. NPDC050389]|uniref:type VII secretion system-associated protein n=1 Tax=Saccharopolyspora sp. NPDC050389 TaxID=3155516 RepID=UPI0033D230B8